MQHDIVQRFVSPLEGHGGNLLLWLPFYPLVIAIGFAPWSAYLPAALTRLWRHYRLSSRVADTLLVWWIAGPLVVFSLAATHLPHYILPIWPALSLSAAVLIDEALDRRIDETARLRLSWGIPITCVLGLATCAALVGVPPTVNVPGLAWPLRRLC